MFKNSFPNTKILFRHVGRIYILFFKALASKRRLSLFELFMLAVRSATKINEVISTKVLNFLSGTYIKVVLLFMHYVHTVTVRVWA